MTSASESLPSDLSAAHAMIVAERAARLEAEAVAASAQAEAALAQAEAARAQAEAANAQADLSSTEALISHLKLEIEKLRRQLYGTRSERKARLLEQMELQLEELEATATEDELAAEKAAARTQTVQSFQRKRPSRKPFPDHLPRERVVIPAPESCPCCGSQKLSKLGEDITETLEVVPRQWKVIQTVREKFSCRECETITQPPAPFHATPRGFAGPNLLAMILFEKFGQHQPLNRQSERYRREGIDLSLSTLADQVGACTTALQPLHALIEQHVLAAERLHGDDTTVPILAKGKTVKGHIWTYVRDDRPFGGRAPPAALYYASRDRRHEHPARHLHGFTGILQADAYSGYNELYDPSRSPGPITAALCWAHARQAVLRAGGYRGQCPARQEGDGDLADRAGNGQAHRRPVRHRTRHQRPKRRRASAGAPGTECAPCGGAGSLAARAAVASLALVPGRRTHRLHAAALGSVCQVHRRWPDLPDEQRGGARTARICPGAEVMAVRRLGARRRSRRLHGHADHDREAQRHRSASLAGGCAGADRRSRYPQARRAVAVELGRRNGAS